MVNIHEEYIRILVRSIDEATPNLLRVSGTLSGLQMNMRTVGAAMMQSGVVVGAIGVGLGLGVAALTDAGAKYQTMLSRLQGNTTITNEQIGLISADILRMHAQTGAPLQGLADSFMHVTNVGYTVAQSVGIVKVALESAIASGSNVSDVANVLAITMHEFGMSASQAGRAMNVFHLAAASSNATLEQFSTGTAKAQAFAANLGVSFVQTEATLAALTRRFSASQASTMFSGELVKIIAHSKAAEAALGEMQARTGRPLVNDFTAAGLAARGLTQVNADLAAGIKATGINILDVIPATRGGLAAMVEMGSGLKDVTNISNTLAATWAGKTDPTTQAFARAQMTLGQQIANMRGSLETTAITIGLQLIPVVQQLLKNINPLISAFNAWGMANAPVIAHTLPLVTALALAAAAFLLVGGFAIFAGSAFSQFGSAVRLLIGFLGLLRGALTTVGLGVFGTQLGIFAAGLAAVILVGVVLYKQWSQFRDVINGIWHLAQTNPLGGIIEGFVQASPGLLLVAAAFKTIFDRVKPVHDIIMRMLVMVRQLIDVIGRIPAVQGITSGVGGAFNNLGTTVNQLINPTTPVVPPGATGNVLPPYLRLLANPLPSSRTTALPNTPTNIRLLNAPQTPAGPTTNHISVHVTATANNLGNQIEQRKLGETISQAIAEAFSERRNTPIRSNAYLPGAR